MAIPPFRETLKNPAEPVKSHLCQDSRKQLGVYSSQANSRPRSRRLTMAVKLAFLGPSHCSLPKPGAAVRTADHVPSVGP